MRELTTWDETKQQLVINAAKRDEHVKKYTRLSTTQGNLAALTNIGSSRRPSSLARR